MPMNVPAQEAIDEFLQFLQENRASLDTTSEDGFVLTFPQNHTILPGTLARAEEYFSAGGYEAPEITASFSGQITITWSKEVD